MKRQLMTSLLKSLRIILHLALSVAVVWYLGELGTFTPVEACSVPLLMPTSVCPEEHKVAYYGIRFVLSVFWLGIVFACIYWALDWLIAKVLGMFSLK